MRWAFILLPLLASCSVGGSKCKPKAHKVCDPTQLEHWEEEQRLKEGGGSNEYEDFIELDYEYPPESRYGRVELRFRQRNC